MYDLIKILALIITVGCYGIALTRKIKLAYVSLVSALLLLLFSVINPLDAFNSINFNVLGVYWGFMMVSIVFMYSKIPESVSNKLITHLSSEKYIILWMCVFTGFLSSFMENVGVLLLMAPIAIHVAKKMGSRIATYLIPITISANIVTTLSMIADPPALLMAMSSGMKFFDFYWFQGKLSIGSISFFGVCASMLSLLFIYRKNNKKAKKIDDIEKLKIDYIPLIIFIVSILFLAFGSSLISPGITGLIFGILSLIYGQFRYKNWREMVIGFDWNSFFFVVGIFVVIKSLEVTGILKDFGLLIASMGIKSPALMILIMTLLSVIMSSFIDNVPFIVLMIPICFSIASELGMNVYPLLFGVLIGTDCGGNLTPLGATANIFACGILDKHGEKLRLGEYLRVSAIFTLSAVIVASLILQFAWR